MLDAPPPFCFFSTLRNVSVLPPRFRKRSKARSLLLHSRSKEDTMNLLRRTRPSLRSLLSAAFRGGGGSGGGLLSNTPTPQFRRSIQTLAPRFRYPIPPSAVSNCRRFYYADRSHLQHFRRRAGPHWYENPRNVLLVIVLGGGAVVTIYYGNLEAVPYTKRTHFVLISPAVERQLGESQFEQLKASLRGKILPPIHPDSVRVRLISKEIIEALQRGLRHGEHRWSDLSYASGIPGGYGVDSLDGKDAIRTPKGGGEDQTVSMDGKWSKEDEILDDSWVQRSRKSGEGRGSQPATQHLEGLNWEVLVVRDNAVNAFCLPGGKIVVNTGLLDHFRTDAEIATVIGHEVGHAIARHSAEMITKNLWFALIQIILLQFFYMPDLINAMSALLLRLPFSRRMETEADYIGLLLLASAGYDPRVAPNVYEKLGKITGDSSLQDYLSTHPSSKKRSQLLTQARVMDEALAIYSEAISGRGMEGFL